MLALPTLDHGMCAELHRYGHTHMIWVARHAAIRARGNEVAVPAVNVWRCCHCGSLLYVCVHIAGSFGRALLDGCRVNGQNHWNRKGHILRTRDGASIVGPVPVAELAPEGAGVS